MLLVTFRHWRVEQWPSLLCSMLAQRILQSKPEVMCRREEATLDNAFQIFRQPAIGPSDRRAIAAVEKYARYADAGYDHE